jgi:hypothetical protein
MIIHTCPSCGYTGYNDAFKRKRIDPTLKERISKEITPLMKDFNVRPEWPYEYAAPERQYEFAAWIAEWKRGSLQSIGDLYLRSAWCCNDFNKPRKERFYRLKALEFFEKAMELKEISARDAGLYTYLIGELHRRVGEIGAASVWFDRVAEATKGDPKQRWLEGLAFQQKTDPKELIGPGKLLPPPPNGYKWCARCFKKVKIQHLLEGYGPGCWSKITHGSEFIDWLEQPTITDRGLAAFSLNAITNQMKVTYDPSIVSIPDIETAVKKAGVTAIPVKSK